MKILRLISVFGRKPVSCVSMQGVSYQEALRLLRRKAEVLREQAKHFALGSSLHTDIISRAQATEQAVTRCEKLLEFQDYSSARLILLSNGIDTLISSR